MSQALLAALLADGAQDGYNIDEHCWHYARVTNIPCPAPESFGAGDRSARYSVATFSDLADQFGHQYGIDSPAPVLTVPGGGSGGAAPAPVGVGGSVAPAPAAPNTPGGGLFSNPMMLILIGVAIWVVMD
jgi:hypothetical protein